MGDDDHGSLLAAQGVNPSGDGTQRVDIQAGVRLIQNGQPRIEYSHLEDLVALLLAAGEALVDGPLEQVFAEVD